MAATFFVQVRAVEGGRGVQGLFSPAGFGGAAVAGWQ